MYWYAPRHPIMCQIYYVQYYPKFWAGILYTIPNSELGYPVPSQGLYWYILEGVISGLAMGISNLKVG